MLASEAEAATALSATAYVTTPTDITIDVDASDKDSAAAADVPMATYAGEPQRLSDNNCSVERHQGEAPLHDGVHASEIGNATAMMAPSSSSFKCAPTSITSNTSSSMLSGIEEDLMDIIQIQRARLQQAEASFMIEAGDTHRQAAPSASPSGKVAHERQDAPSMNANSWQQQQQQQQLRGEAVGRPSSPIFGTSAVIAQLSNSTPVVGKKETTTETELPSSGGGGGLHELHTGYNGENGGEKYPIIDNDQGGRMTPTAEGRGGASGGSRHDDVAMDYNYFLAQLQLQQQQQRERFHSSSNGGGGHVRDGRLRSPPLDIMRRQAQQQQQRMGGGGGDDHVSLYDSPSRMLNAPADAVCSTPVIMDEDGTCDTGGASARASGAYHHNHHHHHQHQQQHSEVPQRYRASGGEDRMILGRGRLDAGTRMVSITHAVRSPHAHNVCSVDLPGSPLRMDQYKKAEEVRVVDLNDFPEEQQQQQSYVPAVHHINTGGFSGGHAYGGSAAAVTSPRGQQQSPVEPFADVLLDEDRRVSQRNQTTAGQLSPHDQLPHQIVAAAASHGPPRHRTHHFGAHVEAPMMIHAALPTSLSKPRGGGGGGGGEGGAATHIQSHPPQQQQHSHRRARRAGNSKGASSSLIPERGTATPRSGRLSRTQHHHQHQRRVHLQQQQQQKGRQYDEDAVAVVGDAGAGVAESGSQGQPRASQLRRCCREASRGKISGSSGGQGQGSCGHEDLNKVRTLYGYSDVDLDRYPPHRYCYPHRYPSHPLQRQHSVQPTAKAHQSFAPPLAEVGTAALLKDIDCMWWPSVAPQQQQYNRVPRNVASLGEGEGGVFSAAAVTAAIGITTSATTAVAATAGEDVPLFADSLVGAALADIVPRIRRRQSVVAHREALAGSGRISRQHVTSSTVATISPPSDAEACCYYYYDKGFRVVRQR